MWNMDVDWDADNAYYQQDDYEQEHGGVTGLGDDYEGFSCGYLDEMERLDDDDADRWLEAHDPEVDARFDANADEDEDEETFDGYRSIDVDDDDDEAGYVDLTDDGDVAEPKPAPVAAHTPSRSTRGTRAPWMLIAEWTMDEAGITDEGAERWRDDDSVACRTPFIPVGKPPVSPVTPEEAAVWTKYMPPENPENHVGLDDPLVKLQGIVEGRCVYELVGSSMADPAYMMNHVARSGGVDPWLGIPSGGARQDPEYVAFLRRECPTAARSVIIRALDPNPEHMAEVMRVIIRHAPDPTHVDERFGASLNDYLTIMELAIGARPLDITSNADLDAIEHAQVLTPSQVQALRDLGRDAIEPDGNVATLPQYRKLDAPPHMRDLPEHTNLYAGTDDRSGTNLLTLLAS
ncbi:MULTISPECIES: hypothetical protein [Bifidobacterium]|uniref:Uncharacterized protein n=1 Tax=Bifidobacterium olomucense TaxID=2675324 RepID=A0A7Y0EW82_9BIFI|nr:MULTISPECIES: hypothetical protein [Bifidobacterium]NMM97580.1 hypothetical protein [Bifidobacterium sp. DSM 109959]